LFLRPTVEKKATQLVLSGRVTGGCRLLEYRPSRFRGLLRRGSGYAECQEEEDEKEGKHAVHTVAVIGTRVKDAPGQGR
jgi:hypothetical protein